MLATRRDNVADHKPSMAAYARRYYLAALCEPSIVTGRNRSQVGPVIFLLLTFIFPPKVVSVHLCVLCVTCCWWWRLAGCTGPIRLVTALYIII